MFLTRDGCHLCVEAEAVLQRTCGELGVGWRSIDVDTVEHLKTRYTDHVPVTFVDGELLGYWFLDDAALRTALAERPTEELPADWLP